MDRRDVVDKALEILAKVGLPDLTMRRLGTELGVQQSALYHHFANKQALLGAVADEILRRGPQTPAPPGETWTEQVARRCADLRAALLAFPDGADVVSSMFAFGLGGSAAQEHLVAAFESHGWTSVTARHGARTVLHFVHGHAVAQQAQEAAVRLGAIGEADSDSDAEFAFGVQVLLRGLQTMEEGR